MGPTTIDYAFFPHLIDLMVDHCDAFGLLKLRSVSRKMRERVDPVLFKHVVCQPSTRNKKEEAMCVIRAAATSAEPALVLDAKLHKPLVSKHTKVLDVLSGADMRCTLLEETSIDFLRLSSVLETPLSPSRVLVLFHPCEKYPFDHDRHSGTAPLCSKIVFNGLDAQDNAYNVSYYYGNHQADLVFVSSHWSPPPTWDRRSPAWPPRYNPKPAGHCIAATIIDILDDSAYRDDTPGPVVACSLTLVDFEHINPIWLGFQPGATNQDQLLEEVTEYWRGYCRYDDASMLASNLTKFRSQILPNIKFMTGEEYAATLSPEAFRLETEHPLAP